MKVLSIDIETYSSVDLKKSGLYKYVQSPDFEILLFAYAYDDGPVQIVDLAQGEKIPYFTLMDLHRPGVEKHAFNAAFEFYCLSKFWETSIEQWHCTMVHALYCGFPSSLDAVGKAMELPQDVQKMSAGRSLIRYFCIPCKPSKTNGNQLRNLPRHDTGKWNLFKEYCKQDVVTERTIKNRLGRYPVPEQEHFLWTLDQKINIGGVSLDTKLIDGALSIHSQISEELDKRAKEITGLENPNSVAQLKDWIMENANLEIESLNKKTVSELLESNTGGDAVQAMLRIRKEYAKTSIKKYDAMKSAICDDGRIRGLLQFYGANRTGRFAGRLVQVQNLPRNYLETLDYARELVKRQKVDALRVIYGNIPDTLSQLIRTAFIPGEGCKFVVADFSAIEARVIAWLAGEEWRLQVFRTHGRIYEASAASMFGVEIDLIRKGNPEYELRAKGKIAELALGYQGASGALIQMGAIGMGLAEEELPDIVARWRRANRRIEDLWYRIEKAALQTVKTGITNAMKHGIYFSRDDQYLFITLPSGRRLFYQCPEIRPNDRGYDSLWYSGVNQQTKKWEKIQTYGGKLTENIVQAVARDCLTNAMELLDRSGYRINFHIHDEVVLECPKDSSQGLEDAIRIMCTLPPWAEGLPLNADGFEGEYYKKE